VLSVVELYELKNFLLQLERINLLIQRLSEAMPEALVPIDTVGLLDDLDPRRDRINTFYIYDDFSEKLGSLRRAKHELEIAIRQEKKQIKQQLEKTFCITMTPKFELLISKSNTALLEKARTIEQLAVDCEDYMTVTYVIKSTPELDAMAKSMDEINFNIDEEELRVRIALSKKVAKYHDQLVENCLVIGELDFVLAKASYAKFNQCCKPEISPRHELEIVDGRHLMVEKILGDQGKPFCPVSIGLVDGVTCITGANMGGKTISLKMAGLVALLAQHGFFVPCQSAKVGLSSSISILIGDTQSMQRGLSSFGSEMEELKDILDQSKENALILIDEIASGTNPVEGLALTKSVISYLAEKKYITLVTTHFDNAAMGKSVRNMQVRGLSGADLDKLGKELHHANRRSRIEVISKYMDYRLYEVTAGQEIPKDALNIASMLGIYDEIIEEAKRILIQN
jgi:DNA mismatch repair ATPase MutS